VDRLPLGSGNRLAGGMSGLATTRQQPGMLLCRSSKRSTDMPNQLPVSGVIPASEMSGENEEETDRLRRMEARARAFLTTFKWCGSIREFYFRDGIGDVFAIFLARIEPWGPNVDEYLWVVVGNLPPAYLVVDDCRTPKEALHGYIGEMRKWVEVAEDGGSPVNVIPVNVPATPEEAHALRLRLDALEHEIIPMWWPSEKL
jgi:hypothetical protein